MSPWWSATPEELHTFGVQLPSVADFSSARVVFGRERAYSRTAKFLHMSLYCRNCMRYDNALQICKTYPLTKLCSRCVRSNMPILILCCQDHGFRSGFREVHQILYKRNIAGTAYNYLSTSDSRHSTHVPEWSTQITAPAPNPEQRTTPSSVPPYHNSQTSTILDAEPSRRSSVSTSPGPGSAASSSTDHPHTCDRS